MREIWLAVLLCSLSGCTAYLQNFPSREAEFRKNSLGVLVYNNTGEALSEDEWNQVDHVINFAYGNLRKCVGGISQDVDRKIREVPIVLLPQRPISGVPLNWQGLIDGLFYFYRPFFLTVFIRYDFLTTSYLRHEWLHAYILFNPETAHLTYHHDLPLFQKCGRLP